MILSNYVREFSVPHTSTCVVKTKGRIYDGDIVSVESPVFPSFNLTTDALVSSSLFDVKAKVTNPDGYFESDGNTEATLVCDDNDTLNMYVRKKQP